MSRHINSRKIYWFCSRCRSEMPNIADMILFGNKNSQSLIGLLPAM